MESPPGINNEMISFLPGACTFATIRYNNVLQQGMFHGMFHAILSSFCRKLNTGSITFPIKNNKLMENELPDIGIIPMMTQLHS